MKNRYSSFAHIVVIMLLAWIPLAMAEDPQVQWPDTRAGQWAEAFFKAYNTDGIEALEAFVRGHYSEAYLGENSPADEAASMAQLREVTGQLDVHSVQALGDFGVEVMAISGVAGWVRFWIALSPEAPHDLDEMGVVPASPPGTETEKPYENWQNLGDLVEHIREDAGVPAMAAAIVRAGKVVDRAVVGVRRSDGSARVQIDDRFQLGSVTKLMTAAMIIRLVDNGLMAWDMTIGQVLPDLPMRDEYRRVTLEELLSFRGGVPNLPKGGVFATGVFDIQHRPHESPEDGRAMLVSQVLSEEPVGRPGEEHYSSSAYVIAGYMAERVTGRSWEDLISHYVFKPLGMTSSGFGWPATENDPNQPHGHYGSPPEITVQAIGDDPMGLHTYLAPAGDVYCSIDDLARYAAFHLRALQGLDELLAGESLQRFFGSEEADDGERWFCAFGTAGTFFAMVALYPDRDLALVAATNCGHHAMSYLKKLRDAVQRRMTP